MTVTFARGNVMDCPAELGPGNPRDVSFSYLKQLVVRLSTHSSKLPVTTVFDVLAIRVPRWPADLGSQELPTMSLPAVRRLKDFLFKSSRILTKKLQKHGTV